MALKKIILKTLCTSYSLVKNIIQYELFLLFSPTKGNFSKIQTIYNTNAIIIIHFLRHF